MNDKTKTPVGRLEDAIERMRPGEVYLDDSLAQVHPEDIRAVLAFLKERTKALRKIDRRSKPHPDDTDVDRKRDLSLIYRLTQATLNG